MRNSSLYAALRVPVSRHVRIEEPGVSVTHRTEPNGELVGDVYVEIDSRLLEHMAKRALKSKSKRAVVGSGLIICRAKNVKHEGGAS